MHQGRGWTAADLCRKTQPQTQPAGLAQQPAWRSTLLLSDVTSEDRKIAQLPTTCRSLPMTERSSGARLFPNFELCSAVTVTLKACLHSRSGEVEHTLAEQMLAEFWQSLVSFLSFVPCALRCASRRAGYSRFSKGGADVEGLMCPPARSCSCHPVLLMLLTQTASSPPNFILIGAGLVWQTLPAG